MFIPGHFYKFALKSVHTRQTQTKR